MCRFLAYSGEAILMNELVFNASNSLVSQSKHATMRANPLNADGFGLGWYPEHDDDIPGTFVSIEPAWSNRNLIQITSKIKTRHFFAHVRDASAGMPVSQSNCHPFQYGPYLWMHNGRLDQFSKFRRNISKGLSDQAFDYIKGNTDSEYAFALFLDEIAFDPHASAQTLKKAMCTTIEKISRYRQAVDAHSNAFINFALTNGHTGIFTRLSTLADVRPASLFYQAKANAVIVASEPLNRDKEDWVKVERNTLLSVSQGQVITEQI
ncbi:class II glutamine amidotransferase [Thalassomonas actiniarum]|uniref:Class II glutamine amidotransferase n=1 Tax=Thalassomonas actiniarum TaxID=485447 RepID=A0AAF0C6K8_9GAMM|nr:class II glutamine amidotransferase [Thalassomonas actiniarum]WDE02401.1 class II glutamine amidotransferase [Thalassomonas actiniarum]